MGSAFLNVLSPFHFQEFPGDIVNPYDDRHVTPGDRAIHAAVDGWLHCFREPAKVLPPGVPRILVREREKKEREGEDRGRDETHTRAGAPLSRENPRDESLCTRRAGSEREGRAPASSCSTSHFSFPFHSLAL